MPRHRLAQYNRKRRFDISSEPRGEVTQTRSHPKAALSYVIQKHDARRLHYDFRLELDGVLKSWAVPKGPSLSPNDKRLAVQVEDHPLSYGHFEGNIPAGEYGGGAVIVWDKGHWQPEGDPHRGLKKGHLGFSLVGERLQGRYSLVRLRERERDAHKSNGKTNWLLIKHADEFVREGHAADITARETTSILSGRDVAEVAQGKTAPRKRQSAKTLKTPPAINSLQLATLVERLDDDRGYVYEIKYDGYRMSARLAQDRWQLISRNGLDWTRRFPGIAAALTELKLGNAVLDGEVCYIDDEGHSDFQLLQNALRSRDSGDAQQRLVYYVFDLLFLNGEDLRALPLIERKKRLAGLLPDKLPELRYSEHLRGDAATVRNQACALGLEGVIAKRADAPYRGGRGKDWLKLKCQNRQEFVIVGMTSPQGARTGLGALLLAVREGEHYRYSGKVGTGFSEKSLADLKRKLTPLIVKQPAVSDAPRMRDVTWVKPRLVCEVSFAEFTRDGILRHSSFEGLREDKPAIAIHQERAVAPPTRKTSSKKQKSSAAKTVREAPRIAGVAITHPERVMDKPSGITKLELATYQQAVAPWLLPFADKRPLALVRCPSGDAQKCFFQKHAAAGFGDSIRNADVDGENVLYVSNAKGILELVQFNVIELHGWGARLPGADKPDWIVFDLDPDTGLAFEKVIDAAFELKEQLTKLGLLSYVKTTGGKGLHVVVPLKPQRDWPQIKQFAHAVAELMVDRAPARYVATMSKRLRRGKIFIDYLRNGSGSTAILPYSPRARANMTVAMPVAWNDLKKVDPRDYTVRTVPGLLKKRRKDPWADMFKNAQSLPKKWFKD